MIAERVGLKFIKQCNVSGLSQNQADEELSPWLSSPSDLSYLLFKMQSAALRTLLFNQQTDHWSMASPIPNRLYKLRLYSLHSWWSKNGPAIGKYWQTTLVARNCETLRHLELRFEIDTAEDFFWNPSAMIIGSTMNRQRFCENIERRQGEAKRFHVPTFAEAFKLQHCCCPEFQMLAKYRASELDTFGSGRLLWRKPGFPAALGSQ